MGRAAMINSDRASNRWVLDAGEWRHRPWWKVAINTVLRSFQDTRSGARLWLVVSVCDEREGRPRCKGYGFRRVEMKHPSEVSHGS